MPPLDLSGVWASVQVLWGSVTVSPSMDTPPAAAQSFNEHSSIPIML